MSKKQRAVSASRASKQKRRARRQRPRLPTRQMVDGMPSPEWLVPMDTPWGPSFGIAQMTPEEILELPVAERPTSGDVELYDPVLDDILRRRRVTWEELDDAAKLWEAWETLDVEQQIADSEPLTISLSVTDDREVAWEVRYPHPQPGRRPADEQFTSRGNLLAALDRLEAIRYPAP